MIRVFEDRLVVEAEAVGSKSEIILSDAADLTPTRGKVIGLSTTGTQVSADGLVRLTECYMGDRVAFGPSYDEWKDAEGKLYLIMRELNVIGRCENETE